MRKPSLATTVTQDFKADFKALLNRERIGHMAAHQYQAANFKGDRVQGSKLWDDFIQASKDYYIHEDEQKLINACVKDVSFNDVVVDLGCGGKSSVMAKMVYLLHKTRASLYVPVDLSQSFLTEAFNAARQKTGVDVAPVHTDFNTGRPTLAPLWSHINEPRVLSVMFGATVMNIECDPAQGFPYEKFKANIEALRELISSNGDLVITYDSCMDIDKVYNSYSHELQRDFGVNMMHRVARDIGINGHYNPDAWIYEPTIHEHDDCLIVAHNVIATENMTFKIDGEKFRIRKGDTFTLDTSIKASSDLVTEALRDAGIRTKEIRYSEEQTATWHRLKL